MVVTTPQKFPEIPKFMYANLFSRYLKVCLERRKLTVVVFGEACSEALTFLAPCNLRGLNVRVTPQGMSCKTRRGQ